MEKSACPGLDPWSAQRVTRGGRTPRNVLRLWTIRPGFRFASPGLRSEVIYGEKSLPRT
jgi:hypothetical protein